MINYIKIKMFQKKTIINIDNKINDYNSSKQEMLEKLLNQYPDQSSYLLSIPKNEVYDNKYETYLNLYLNKSYNQHRNYHYLMIMQIY